MTSMTSMTSKTTTVLPSKGIILLSALAALVLSALDINYHGHYNDATICKNVERHLKTRRHIEQYLEEQTDDWGQKELGTVEIRCRGRKVVVAGKVLNSDIRDEISDAALSVPGVASVDNQLEVLNVPELEALQSLLKTAPYNVQMNYQVSKRGTLYLTGDLPRPELKDQITALVGKIRGVRSVVNEMGEHLQTQRFLRVNNIWFDFNQWKIRPQSEPILDDVSQRIEEYLGRNPGGHIRIEGHTDSIANDKYNQWLSEKRATAVLDALVRRGIPADRLKAVGRGESQLLVTPDDTPEKRAENRRIEFYFE